MELLAFGRSGARVLVFPTRQGRFFDYEDWGLVKALASHIDSGRIQLFCVDSIDSESLYCGHTAPRNRILRHIRFEQYLLEEVVPLTGHLNPDRRLITHGCSIGAYHAVNTALRNPFTFTGAVGLSGRYDLTRRVGEFPDLFDGYYDQDIYFHTPPHFIPNLENPRLLSAIRKLDLQLAVGVTDWFRPSNEQLSRALWDKGVWHRLDLWPGRAHNADAWRGMVGEYF